MPRKSIFISMGRPYTPAQKQFLEGLIELVKQNGLEPRVMNVTDYPTGNPLKGIAQVLRECSGVVVVASERTFFPTGVEKRNSADQQALSKMRYTTPWNQIESAMSYVLDIPILVIAERGLKEEGLLEEKYDWYVERVDIEPSALNEGPLRNRLAAWCRTVSERKGERRPIRGVSGDIALGEFLKELPVKLVWQMALIAASLIAAGATFGAFIKPLLTG